jgi:DeoR/GlpR family transcriptional regulator of sugar metabolism
MEMNKPATASQIPPGRQRLILERAAQCFAGPTTVSNACALFADKALVCPRGITPEGQLSDADPLEGEIRRALIANSREPILLVMRRTLTHRGLYLTTSINDIHLVLATGISDEEATWLSGFVPRLKRV